MSDDRLERALNAMKNEHVSETEAAHVRDRVLEKFDLPEEARCGKFRIQLVDYLANRLDEAPRLLLEDHLSRCPQCRRVLVELRDGHDNVTAMPQRRARTSRWLTWAAAAALLITISYMGRGIIDTALAWGPRATVASVDGQLFLVPEGILQPGAEIGENQIVRTGPASKAVLRLKDGSLVELNERTELALHAAFSGRAVRLRNGDVIVEAARQRHGHLSVETRESTASVKGTVFAVSAGLGGSRVSVIEGSVEVEHSGTKRVLLRPGEQSASNPALLGSINDTFLWSPKADEYLSILGSLSEIEQQLATLSAKPMRTQSLLLEILPPDVVLYGAIPNIDDTIVNAGELVDQQASANPVFGAWLNSSNGQDLRQLLDRIHSMTYLLGDEIVFGISRGISGEISGSVPGNSSHMPFVLAQIHPGKRVELESALADFSNGNGNMPLYYALSDAMVSISDSAAHLDRLNAGLGEGVTASPTSISFIDAIRRRYERGAGWLLAVNTDSVFEIADKSEKTPGPQNVLTESGLKYLFLEQRTPQGMEQNELTLAFNGHRKGLASFLASTGSGGAAEYLPHGVLGAGYVSTREPRQVFDEMAAFFASLNPSFQETRSDLEARLGVNFSSDLAAALGTEYALGIEGVSISGPAWVLAALVNDATAFDDAMARLVQGINLQAAADGEEGQLVLERESIDGRVWNSLKFPQSPITATWTYDRGYLIASASRGGALRAIAARNGGAALVRSSEFQRQLSTSLGMHPAGFAWLNTQGVFAEISQFTENLMLPKALKALEERDPTLVIFTATPEEIRATSHVRMSGIIMGIMLMENGAGRRE